ncbi:MAG: sugar phosphate isomerase/epimerase [Planctomycetota bacterium]|nr:MAG: sugar phosphate isomerase/epimerase [Planctomycetota bacterium]
MLQLGFASAIVPDLTFREVFELARDIGYDCVEVMCWPVSKAERRYAGVTHIDVAALDDAKIAEIQQVVGETGVSISALGYYPNCLSADRAEATAAAEHLCRVIEASHRLGIGRVNTFIGRDHTQSVEANWPRLVDTWTPILELADRLDIRIGIENCPMSFTEDEWPGGKNIAVSPAIWRKLFEQFATSNLGLNYDPSHMVWQYMDYLAPIRNFSQRLFHVHAKDVRIDRHRLNEVGILAYPLQYHTPKLPGLGEIDWGAFMSTLLDVGYAGPVCVEVEDRAYEGSLETRKMSLVQSHRYLKNFMP